MVGLLMENSPELPETAEDLYDLARSYVEQGKYEQAELLLQRMLALSER